MFYYAVLNENMFVVDLVASETEITDNTYISITEDQFTNGDLLWLYYKPATGQFVVCDNFIGSSDWIIYKNTDRPITPKFDEIDSELAGKADSDHNHDSEYAALTHTHAEYAAGTHNHDDLYAAKTHETNTTIHVTAAEKNAWNGKAAADHNHDSEYAEINHVHTGFAGTEHTHNTATATTAGFISASDKAKLDGIAAGATAYTHPETHPASMITETDSRKFMTAAERTKLAGIAENANNYVHPATHAASMITGLSNVATSGDYEDLANKPTIPEAYAHPATHPASMITGLSDVATSGDYQDLANKPAIPTIPESLPANGGNADTVGGYHASDFATAQHNHDAAYASATHTHDDLAAVSHTHGQSDITGLVSALNGKASASHTHGEATTAAAGFMSAADKTKLNGIAAGANAYTHPASHPASMITGLAGVATSGSYNDLSNKPTIPAAYTHPASHPASMITGLSSVATSGSYNDLTNKPSTFTPAAHTHAQSEISGLASALSGKAAASHAHAITEITGLEDVLDGKASLIATEITEVGTDLNNYTTGGMFSFSVASAPLNIPSGVTNGWLIVIPWSEGSGTIKQIFLRHGTTNSTDHFMYTRLHTNTAGWGNWTTVYTTGNPPTASEVGAISKDLQMTSDTGDISLSWSGKNVVTEFKNLSSGMYTVYSPTGNAGNPNSSESFRFMCHKTGSANYGWIMAYGAKGSVYTGYVDNTNWQGWKCLYDANPQPLWTGAQYMIESHTVTPSKALSECRNGWLLLWSDYDPGEGSNNTDFAASVIPKRAYTGQKWAGGQWYCDVPRYSAGSATDSEGRSIKLLLVHDTKIVGTENNDAAPRNDIVLRAVYEW